MVEKPTYEELEQRVKVLERDEAKLKRAEERLKASEKRSRAWLEYSPACTKIVDLDFNLQYMSAAGTEALKIGDVTQLYGKPYPFDFYPESFWNRMARNLEKVKETGEIITQEAAVVDIYGNGLWFHSTLVPVNDDEGRIDYIIVVSIDITERKQAEEDLRKALDDLEKFNLELETKVEERTEELMEKNRQLAGAEKLAALGQMANRVAHELRNPLTAIGGFARRINEQTTADDPSKKYLQMIVDNVITMETKVSEITETQSL